jgi:hypothetical protein
MNTAEEKHRFALKVSGIDTLTIASDAFTEVPGATTVSFPVRVRAQPHHGQAGSNRIMFEIRAVDLDHVEATEKSVFIIPR